MTTHYDPTKDFPGIVHRGEDGKWYFWGEDWCSLNGPFLTEERAKRELEKYIEHLEKKTNT
jgi:hypothetical protein